MTEEGVPRFTDAVQLVKTAIRGMGGSEENLRSHYQLRSMTDGRLLLVSGHRRWPGHLESSLLPLEGEQLVILTRAADQPPQIVVRAPVEEAAT